MKAVIAHEPGGPEVLHGVQRPVPTPEAGEVLIHVAAAGVNRPDLMQRSGAPIRLASPTYSAWKRRALWSPQALA